MSEDPRVSSTAVAQALSHPLRRELLDTLQGRVASARELASEMSVPTGRVVYHLGCLREAGCVVLQLERPSGGSGELFFTAKPGAAESSRRWSDAPASTRDPVISAALDVFLDGLTGAGDAAKTPEGKSFETEIFFFDQLGRELANKVVQSALSQLRQLHAESEGRAYVTEAELTPTVIGLTMLEVSVPPKKTWDD